MPLSASAQLSQELLQEIEKLSAQLPFTLSRFNWHEDSKHPARTALTRAFIDRLNTLIPFLKAVKALANHSDAEDALNMEIEKLNRALADLSELRAWVFTPAKPMTKHEADAVLPFLQKYGFDLPNIVEIHGSLQKRRVGPPAERRQLYVDAFERMLRPRSSLGTVMNKLCKCDNPSHKGCTKTFQAGIGEVKKLLRRYAPELVLTYETLHPDRATLKSHQKSMTR